MTTTTPITLHLDADDIRDVYRALALRKTWVTPDGDPCQTGTMIAEICRGWMEMIDLGKIQKAEIDTIARYLRRIGQPVAALAIEAGRHREK